MASEDNAGRSAMIPAVFDADAQWERYQHYKKPEIEFDVLVEPWWVKYNDDGEVAHAGPLTPKTFPGPPDPDFPGTMLHGLILIRTVRNDSYKEEAYVPAYTTMPDTYFEERYKVKENA